MGLAAKGREGCVRSRTDTQSHSLSSLTNGREATQVEVEWSPVGHGLGHCDVVSRGHDMTKQISAATMPSYVCTKGAKGRLCRITQFGGRDVPTTANSATCHPSLGSLSMQSFEKMHDSFRSTLSWCIPKIILQNVFL